MKKRTLNIQLFGKDMKTPNMATYGKRMSETEANAYYSKVMEEYIYDEYNFFKYFDEIELPQNNGKKMKFRKSGRYYANGEPLAEGVIPDEDKPMSSYWFEVTLQDFGGFIKVTDDLDLYSMDKGESTRLQINQSHAVGELFQLKARDILYSSPNRFFATPVDSNGKNGQVDTTSLNNARKTCGKFNLSDLSKIKVALKRNKVKGYEGGDYVFLITPEVEADIMTLAKNNSQFTFVEIANYQQNEKPLMEGEIGRWNGFRFVVDNTLGQIGTYTTETGTGATHGCVILGKFDGEKGAKLVKLEGYGKPRSYIADPEKNIDTETNPIGQIGHIGWKVKGWGGLILYAEAVMIYECQGDDIMEYDTETMYKKNANFIGGYDADGNPIEKDANAGKPTANFSLLSKAHVITIKSAYNNKSVGEVTKFIVDETSSSVTFDAFLTDEQVVREYADAYSGGTIVLYTDVACETAFDTSTTVTKDMTLYIKKNVA